MSKQAVCGVCGATVPMGDDYGRIDIRRQTSEHRRDEHGRRGPRRTAPVVVATLCLRCMADVAGTVADLYGLPEMEVPR